MTEKATKSRLSFGPHLKRERELRGIELEEIARVTRVRLAYLEAMERESLDELPADVYTRGYIRAYARHLGIEPEPCIALFEEQTPKRQPSPAVAFRGEMQVPEGAEPSKPLPSLASTHSGSPPAPGGRTTQTIQPPRRLSLALAIVLLFIAAITIYTIYQMNQPGDAGADRHAPSTTETATFDVTG